MSCDLHEASMRLIGMWVSRVLDDPDYANRCPLREVLTDRHVRIVAAGDLLAEFGEKRRTRVLRQTDWDEARGKRLISAWLDAVDDGRRQ